MHQNWLTAIEPQNVSSFFDTSYEKDQPFPAISAAKVVVFFRDSTFGNTTREAFSHFQNHFSFEIIDVGNLQSLHISAIYQLISDFSDGAILPVLIGISEVEFKEVLHSFLKEKNANHGTFISNKIFGLEEHLKVDNLGFQRHFVPKHILNGLQDFEGNNASLGLIRAQFEKIEPILRETRYLHLDARSIRSSENGGVADSFPTGFTTEEICQLLRFAGESHALQLVTIDTGENATKETSLCIATALWYLFEGLAYQNSDHPTLSKNFKEFIIELNEVDKSLIFLKSNFSGKWWLKKTEDSTTEFLACSHTDYEDTIKNEIPDRLLKFI